MTTDAQIVIGIRGDVAGGRVVKRTLDDIKMSGRAATSGMQELTQSVLKLGAAYLSVRTGINQFNAAIGAGAELQQLNNKMAAATKNAEVVAQSFAFLRDISEELGLQFSTSANAFGGFSAAALRAGLTFGDVKTIFENVATAATSMNLSSETTTGIFKALEQMASKGTVQLEELKLQLGDRLPGAVEIFAKSMGVSSAEFNKMISNGEVGIDKLRGFSETLKNELGGSATEASKQFVAESNRLKNAVFDLRTEFANSGSLTGYTSLVKTLADTFKDDRFLTGVKAVGQWTGFFLGNIAANVAYLGSFVDLIGRYKTAVSAFTGVGDQFQRVDFGGAQLPKTAASLPFNTSAQSSAIMKSGKTDFYSITGMNKPLDSYTLSQGRKAGGGAVEQANKEQKAIEKTTSALQFQLEQLRRNDVQQQIHNNLRSAGVTLESAAGQNIARLTQEYASNSAELEKQERIIDGLAGATEGFFKSAFQGAEGFKGALRGLIGSLADLAFQMAVIEPIKNNLFGGGKSSGGGILGSLFGNLFGGGSSVPIPGRKPATPFGFASGGSMTLGGVGGVDQNLLSLNGMPIARTGRGEVLSISPNQKGNGNGVTVNQTINLSMGVAEAVAQQFATFLPQIEKATQAAIHEAQARGIQA